jgi:hypothetical protein
LGQYLLFADGVRSSKAILKFKFCPYIGPSILHHQLFISALSPLSLPPPFAIVNQVINSYLPFIIARLLLTASSISSVVLAFVL